MSGKPSVCGVNKLLWAIHRYEEADREAVDLLVEVTTKQEKLKKLNDERDAQYKEMWLLMEQMDVASPGNYGHELRMTWLLSELLRQIRGKQVNGISYKEEVH